MKVHVLAVLGTSPAVLTEAIWWLVTQRNAQIVGVEVWTTGDPKDRSGSPSGWSNLLGSAGGGMGAGVHKLWAELKQGLPPGTSLPDPPADLAFVSASELGAAARTGKGRADWRVVGFEAGGRRLGDVRNSEDSESVVRQLFERVRALRVQGSGTCLPGDVRLVGLLSGGRKTMSAALQTAFELQARPHDQLLHVLLHPKLERRDIQEVFAVPTAHWERECKVPLAEQVTCYSVPFPNVRALIAAQPPTARRIAADWDTADYESLLGWLQAAQGSGRVRGGRLRHVDAGGKYSYVLEATDRSGCPDGDAQAWQVTLTHEKARIYLAIWMAGRRKAPPGSDLGEVVSTQEWQSYHLEMRVRENGALRPKGWVEGAPVGELLTSVLNPNLSRLKKDLAALRRLDELQIRGKRGTCRIDGPLEVDPKVLEHIWTE